jgi:hypothetical protein
MPYVEGQDITDLIISLVLGHTAILQPFMNLGGLPANPSARSPQNGGRRCITPRPGRALVWPSINERISI